MVGPWAYGGFEGWHVDRWLSSRAGLTADVLRGRTSTLVSVICSVIVVLQIQTQIFISTYLVAVADMSTMRCAWYSTLFAKYIAYQPVCAISTLVPDRSSVFAVLHNQDKIFIPTYLRFCCKYVDNSICLILHICCQI